MNLNQKNNLSLNFPKRENISNIKSVNKTNEDFIKNECNLIAKSTISKTQEIINAENWHFNLLMEKKWKKANFKQIEFFKNDANKFHFLTPTKTFAKNSISTKFEFQTRKTEPNTKISGFIIFLKKFIINFIC